MMNKISIICCPANPVRGVFDQVVDCRRWVVYLFTKDLRVDLCDAPGDVTDIFTAGRRLSLLLVVAIAWEKLVEFMLVHFILVFRASSKTVEAGLGFLCFAIRVQPLLPFLKEHMEVFRNRLPLCSGQVVQALDG